MGRCIIGATCALAICIVGTSGFSILARVDATLEHLGTANDQLMTANARLGIANQQLAEMKSRLTEVNVQLVATNWKLDATQANVALANAKIDKTNEGLVQTIAQLGVFWVCRKWNVSAIGLGHNSIGGISHDESTQASHRG